MKNYKDFAEKINDFCRLENAGLTNDNVYSQTLLELAAACAASVLKKVIDPTRHTQSDKPVNSGFNPALVAMKAELPRLLSAVETMYFSNDEKAINALIQSDMGEAFDLVQEAAAAILEEVAKQREREPMEAIDLERQYKLKRMKKHVYNKVDNISGVWEIVDTTPIQEVFRAVRRAIASSKAMATDPRNGYSYIDDVLTDPETGEDVSIYRRLPKFADLGGAVVDYNGKETAYTTDAAAVDIVSDIMSKLDLTDRQRQVVTYRLQGYGYKAIAKKLGVTQRAIATVLTTIQNKAEKIGFVPGMYKEMSAC